MSVPRPSPDLPQDSGAYTPAQAPYTASAYPGGAPAASPSPASWHQIVLYAVPVLALLGLISTFLPVATVTIGDESHSANYWSDSVDAKGEAILLLILFLVATGLGVAAAVRRLRPLLITTGAISAIAGIFGTIDGFGNLGNYSDDDLDLRGFIETDPGIGTYLLAFAGSSLVGFAVDFLALLLLMAITHNLLFSVITARLLSATINYLLNRHAVFRDGDRSTPVRYALLVCGILVANYVLLRALSIVMPLVAAKLLTEFALFTISFASQRALVFTHKELSTRKGHLVTR